MAFCQNCGASLGSNARFCGVCGTPVNKSASRYTDSGYTDYGRQTNEELDSGPFKSYGKFIKGTPDFRGLTGRSDFWYVVLMQGIIFSLIAVPLTFVNKYGKLFVYEIMCFYVLFSLVPTVAILIRRLRDTGRSPVLALFYLIPVAGIVFYFIFNVKRSYDTERLLACEAAPRDEFRASRTYSFMAGACFISGVVYFFIHSLISMSKGFLFSVSAVTIAVWVLSIGAGVLMMLKNNKGILIAILACFGLLAIKETFFGLKTMIGIGTFYLRVYGMNISYILCDSFVTLMLLFALINKRICAKIWFIIPILAGFALFFNVYGYVFHGISVPVCIAYFVEFLGYLYLSLKLKYISAEPVPEGGYRRSRSNY